MKTGLENASRPTNAFKSSKRTDGEASQSRTYLVSSPSGVPGNVDDGSEAGETTAVSVHSGMSVVVELGAQLQGRGTGNPEQQVRTVRTGHRQRGGWFSTSSQSPEPG